VPGLLSQGFGFTLAERLFPQLTGGETQMLNAKNGLCWTFKLPIPDAVNDTMRAERL
jgi:two-component sensor histidine kinase